MFENNKLTFSCKWNKPFDEVSAVLTKYFLDWKQIEIMDRADGCKLIKTNMASVCIRPCSGNTEIAVVSPIGYDEIDSAVYLFEKLNNVLIDSCEGIEILGMYADYIYDDLDLKKAINIIKLSYTWNKYNVAFTKALEANEKFYNIPTVVMESLKRMKYIATFDRVKTMWQLEVNHPIVDLSAYFMDNEKVVTTYLGRDITMLEALLRYFLYFFTFAETYSVHKLEKKPQNETAAFQVKFRNVAKRDEPTKRMKKKLYSRLSSL